MLTQIRNLACQLKRQNAEIEFAIHRNRADKLERTASWNRADKLERPASWNANPNSYKAGIKDVGGVVMIKFVNLYETHLSRTPCEPVEKFLIDCGPIAAEPPSEGMQCPRPCRAAGPP